MFNPFKRKVPPTPSPPTDEEIDLIEIQVTEEPPETPPEPTWEEKREHPRLLASLGLMSPAVAGFKALSHDITTVGLRMICDSELTVGKIIKLRLELDDARIAPMEVTARVVWCSSRPTETAHGGFWGGLRFEQISPEQQETLHKWMDEARQVEAGVFNRDYASD